jgi:hypothetical protein
MLLLTFLKVIPTMEFVALTLADLLDTISVPHLGMFLLNALTAVFSNVVHIAMV